MLKATFELHKNTPIESLACAADSMQNKSQLSMLIAEDNQLIIPDMVERLSEIASNESILNDVDGYIRLTEDEINEIINNIEPVKEEVSKIEEDPTTVENSITCTSF